MPPDTHRFLISVMLAVPDAPKAVARSALSAPRNCGAWDRSQASK